MSDPVQTTPPPQATDNEFDLLEFWIRHGRKIIIYGVVLVVALVGWGIYQWIQHRTRTAAANSLATAASVEDYRKVVSEYEKSGAAASAELLLAETLRKEGKFADANTALRKFIDGNPNHPMLPGAWFATGVNLEALQKPDEAEQSYAKVATAYPGSYAAPLAMMSQARLLQAKGQSEAAKRLYEQVINQFQGTVFWQEAFRESAKIKPPVPQVDPAKPAVAEPKVEAASPPVTPNQASPNQPAPTPLPPKPDDKASPAPGDPAAPPATEKKGENPPAAPAPAPSPENKSADAPKPAEAAPQTPSDQK